MKHGKRYDPYKWDAWIVVGLVLAAVFVAVLASTARTQGLRQFRGVVCDTAEQVENWLVLWKSGEDGNEALAKINKTQPETTACGVIQVLTMDYEVVKELVVGDNEHAVILKLIVIGVMSDGMMQQTPPLEQFISAPAKGFVTSKTSI